VTTALQLGGEVIVRTSAVNLMGSIILEMVLLVEIIAQGM